MTTAITLYSDATLQSLQRYKTLDRVICENTPRATLDVKLEDLVSLLAYLYDAKVVPTYSYEVNHSLEKICTYITLNLASTVVFTQTPQDYIFKVSLDNGSEYPLPLLTTRRLFSHLRKSPCKVVITKQYKSLISPIRKALFEMAFLGTPSESNPNLQALIKVTSSIKGKSSALWATEDDEALQLPTPNKELSETNSRFRGAPWFRNAQQDVTLIGCGSLGSWIATFLGRVLGDKTLTLQDPDLVELANLSGQNFGLSDVGISKVGALNAKLHDQNPLLQRDIYSTHFTSNSDGEPIMITGLDNMATRKLAYFKWRQACDKTSLPCLFIDARMNAEAWQIFCLTPDNTKALKEYEDKWLFPQEEADPGICSYKQTAYASAMCASYVVNLYINFCANLSEEAPVKRFLPFMMEYEASQMILRTSQF